MFIVTPREFLSDRMMNTILPEIITFSAIPIKIVY